VEVHHNSEWGTVCDDQWNWNDAQVVCKELGFGNAVDVRVKSFYGPGSGQIWLDQLHCIGTELTIGNCLHDEWGLHNCGHDEDAGVRCSGGIF